MTSSLHNPLSGFMACESGAADLGGIERILDAIRRHLGMEVAFVAEFSEGRRVFREVSEAGGASRVRPGASDPLEETYCQRLLDGRFPEVIPDTAALPEAAALPVTRSLEIGAYMGVPLRLRDGAVYGTLCCFSPYADPSLNQRDLNMLKAFAELAIAEIEARLMAERRRLEIITRVEAVVAENKIRLVFQPIYRLDDGRAEGVECLARFPDCESRPPNLWFSEAATVGLGIELELAAIRKALASLAELPESLSLSVNVSPATVLSDLLEPLVAAAPPGRLILEVTEHEVIEDYVAFARALEPLRKHVRLAIDDVGAGYSGMRHILDLKPDFIKLDMSLVRDIDRDPARRALALALVDFAYGIGSQIIAEGVETKAELEALRTLGVSKGQGYHLSRPMTLTALGQFLPGERCRKTGAADRFAA